MDFGSRSLYTLRLVSQTFQGEIFFHFRLQDWASEVVQRGERMGISYARQPGDARSGKGEGGVRTSGECAQFLQPLLCDTC